MSLRRVSSRALVTRTRLTIIQHLYAGGTPGRRPHRTPHLAQSTVSAHLACLRDCGLVVSRPKGRASMWSLAVPELLDLLRAAEVLLEVTGDSVTLCPTHEDHVEGPEATHAPHRHIAGPADARGRRRHS